MRKFSRKDTWWTRWLNEWWRWCVCAGTPVNRIPIMAKQTLDLYELFRLVVSKGGLVEVINKKLWREITKGLNLPSSITSAAFTLRTQSVPSRRSSSKTLKLNEWPRWIIVLSGLGRHLDKAIWRQNRSNTISGFAFVDIAAFRRSKSMSKPNFVDISQLIETNVRHIGNLLSVLILTICPKSAHYSASGYWILSKSKHPLRKYDVISISQDGGRDGWILLSVSYLLMSLLSEGQRLLANQILSRYLKWRLRYFLWQSKMAWEGIIFFKIKNVSISYDALLHFMNTKMYFWCL